MKDEIKYHWIDYIMPFPYNTLDIPSIENVDYEFKLTFQTIEYPVNEISSIVFSFRDQKRSEKKLFSFFVRC